MTSRDRELGLFQPITRRDVLHGMGAAFVGTLASPWVALGREEEIALARVTDDYPDISLK